MPTIKERAEEQRATIRWLQGEIKIAQAKLGVIQDECSHPNKYTTSCMGDRGTHCPDCGLST